MPTFSYVARDATGVPRRGTAEGAAAAAVKDELRRRGWLVLEVRAEAGDAEAGDALARLNPLDWLPPRSVDVEVSLKQLAVMLRSGLSLLRALQVVPAQTQRRSMARVWLRVSRRIQEGSSLADAMGEHRAFSSLVTQLVRVGEQTGGLEQVLGRAAESMERRRNLRTSVLTAFMYPTIVLVMTLGVTAFLVLSVLPKIRVFLSSLGRQLPPMTQLLIDISAFVNAFLVQGLIVAFAGLLGLALVYSWPPGRLTLDRWLLRVPIAGRVLRLAATVQLARNLGDLLRSGITLLEGLRTAEQLLQNRYLSERVALARERVMAGSSLAEPLNDRRAFMPMLPAMVAVGETAGTLDEVLDEVATFHESELQALIRRLSVLIEPVVIVIVGALVGFVYLSVFMAIYAAQGGPQ